MPYKPTGRPNGRPRKSDPQPGEVPRTPTVDLRPFSWVYVATCPECGLVKVGMSDNPHDRVRGLYHSRPETRGDWCSGRFYLVGLRRCRNRRVATMAEWVALAQVKAAGHETIRGEEWFANGALDVAKSTVHGAGTLTGFTADMLDDLDAPVRFRRAR